MSAAGTAVTPSGWPARLDLGFEASLGRTRLTHRRHSGPLLVQKPLYPEGDTVCHTCIVHPPGGVASGDRLELAVTVGPGAHALLTTPASSKFYRKGAIGASRAQQVLESTAGVVEWLPQENIFFPDAAADVQTVVRLVAGARFIGWEIACLGLPACGRGLEGGEVRTAFELWVDGHPLLLERLRLDQNMQQAAWGMAGHSALGTALLYPATTSDLAVARATLADRCDEMRVACTLVDGVMVCRGVAHRADQLRASFVRLWNALRPQLLGRAATSPRIWAT